MRFYIAVVLIFINLLSLVKTNKECERPENMRMEEERCWTEQIELIDRLQQTSRNVLNFAKKKLGMTIDAENGPQKCEYYQCIFKHLNMLNANDYPVYDDILSWIEQNVIMSQGTQLIERLQMCNDALNNATVNDKNFYASQMNFDQYSLENNTMDPNPQSKCQRNAEFMKCLSIANECSTFAYP